MGRDWGSPMNSTSSKGMTRNLGLAEAKAMATAKRTKNWKKMKKSKTFKDLMSTDKETLHVLASF